MGRLSERKESIRASNTGTRETPNFHLIILFDVLYFTDLVCVSILLLTAWLSPQVRRASTWFAAIGTGLVSGSANLMLLGHQTGAPPTPGSTLCLVQAALVHSSAVLGSVYSTAFILQFYMSLLLVRKSTKVISKKHTTLLHVVPCISFILAFVGFLIFGLSYRTTTQRSPSGMYCHISNPLAGEIAGGIALICMIAIFIIEGLIVRSLRRASWTVASTAQGNEIISKGAIIRVFVFSLVPLLVIAWLNTVWLWLSHRVSAYQYFHEHTPETAIFAISLSIIPLFVVILFGSQKDILRVWLPSRFFREPAPTSV